MVLHNKNHRILDDADGFGSTYQNFATTDLEPQVTKTEIYITIAVSLVIVKKKEDDPGNYCQYLPSDDNFDMDYCTGKYYAQSIGCLSPWESYYSPDYPWCKNSSQFEGACFLLWFLPLFPYIALSARIPQNQA